MADPPLSRPRLCLALTLPGAVSLGAYHGGAMAALLTAARESDGQIIIDALATASAGSLTGVLAARSLLRGADPVALMVKAWVEADSLTALRSNGTESVLDPAPLRELAADLMSPRGSVPDGDATAARQVIPVRISMALASLGGLAYRVPSLDEDQPWFNALTHLDWWNHTFGPDDGDDGFIPAIAPALASAANALGFPPVRLDRSADRATYEANHVVAPPIRPGRPPEDQWALWYTDGGTLDDEPFGRALRLVAEAEADPATHTRDLDERLFVLVEPEPAAVDFNGRWWNPDTEPRWTFTLFDVFNLRGEQSIYDDLRRLEKTNTRLRWAEEATTALTQALTEALDAVEPDGRAAVEVAIRGRLGAALEAMDQDRRTLSARGDGNPSPATADDNAGAPSDVVPPNASYADLVGQIVRHTGGLRGKREARVEMVSPLIDGDSPPVSDRLAGDFLFHFGGFVDEEFRRHDFLVGWSNMRTWLGQHAAEYGFARALDEVDRRRDQLGWTLGDLDPSIGSLSVSQKLNLARAAGHVGRVIAHDLADLLGHDDEDK